MINTGVKQNSKMYDLTELERSQASQNKYSKIPKISRMSVIRTIQNFCEGKSLKTQPRTGCPKLLNFEHQKTLKQNQLNK
jgi:transposase